MEKPDTKAALRAEIEALRTRVEEAEHTLDAIRSGHVDALVVAGASGEQIFTLQSADHRYRRLVESMSEGAAVVSPEGTILYGNGRLAELLEVPLERLMGSSFSAFLEDEPRAAFEAVLALPPEDEARTLKNDIEMVTSSGGRVPVHLSVASAPSEEGGHVAVVVTDLTGSRLLAREQAARADAERVNRAKDEFLTTLSHELRTPLTAVLGWTRMLLTAKLEPQTARRGLETIERNARAQGRIIEDLLEVSRIITGKLTLNMRPIDVVPVIDAAIDVVRPAADAKGVRVEGRLEHAAIMGDPDRLQQVAWNLLVNAVKFTPKGGRIDVELQSRDGQVELRVTDTGVGIRPDFVPHVFDRFSQADGSTTRAYGGLGVGLAIVRHLVEMHGGTARVASEGEGHGAVFTVRIPATTLPRPTDEAPPQASGAEIEHMLRGLHVLVVEDDEDTRRFLGEALAQWGASVKLTASVDEALSAIERRLPDVLVSDIGMPDKDGHALISAVRARSRRRGGRLPALALTAYAGAEERMRILAGGFDMHIPKPVEPAELATAVAKLARAAMPGEAARTEAQGSAAHTHGVEVPRPRGSKAR